MNKEIKESSNANIPEIKDNGNVEKIKDKVIDLTKNEESKSNKEEKVILEKIEENI